MSHAIDTHTELRGGGWSQSRAAWVREIGVQGGLTRWNECRA